MAAQDYEGDVFPLVAAAAAVTMTPPALLQELHIGNWRQLFNADQSRFPDNIKGFESHSKATDDYKHRFPLQLQTLKNKELIHTFLERTFVSPPGLSVDDVHQVCVESLFPEIDAEGSVSEITTRFLMCPPGWDETKTYGELLAMAYVLLQYRFCNDEKRDSYEPTKPSKWPKVKANFLNSFVAFMIQSMLNGPNVLLNKMKTLRQQDQPLMRLPLEECLRYCCAIIVSCSLWCAHDPSCC